MKRSAASILDRPPCQPQAKNREWVAPVLPLFLLLPCRPPPLFSTMFHVARLAKPHLMGAPKYSAMKVYSTSFGLVFTKTKTVRRLPTDFANAKNTRDRQQNARIATNSERGARFVFACIEKN